MPTTAEGINDIGYRVYKAFINKIWYPFLTRRLSGQEVTFLNYGYEDDPPLGLPLDASDEPNRYSINLYHRHQRQRGALAGQQRTAQVGLDQPPTANVSPALQPPFRRRAGYGNLQRHQEPRS